jgi:hypothetical protein
MRYAYCALRQSVLERERRNALRLLRPTAAGRSLNEAHRFHT